MSLPLVGWYIQYLVGSDDHMAFHILGRPLGLRSTRFKGLLKMYIQMGKAGMLSATGGIRSDRRSFCQAFRFPILARIGRR